MFYFFKIERPVTQVIFLTAALVIGAVVGTLLGTAITGVTPFLGREYAHFIQAILLGVLFGSIISYFFYSRERISATETMIQEERISRLSAEKRAVETNLRLLQAQIEPHFLFNTLSNILSLLETDLEKAKSMLVDLIHYLRTSLSKTRYETTTLAQEMELIRAYLNIYKVRMGDRLRYEIDIPERMKERSFPPMLVQPLVENAIRHGLEPKIEGGELCIRGEDTEEAFRLEIIDTGLGFHEGDDQGVGLSNVRKRLRSLYGDKGRLILEENGPSGLRAIIEVPHDASEGNHC
jgi:sensor histidine kinase YesM